MTEEECLTHSYAIGIPAFISKPEYIRRIRLFACATCRRLWHLLPDQCQRGVVIAELHADGQAADEDLAAAQREAFGVHIHSILSDKAKSGAADAVYKACAPSGH